MVVKVMAIVLAPSDLADLDFDLERFVAEEFAGCIQLDLAAAESLVAHNLVDLGSGTDLNDLEPADLG